MMTNASSGATWGVNATCPKCGKPYMYIGDPIGDVSQLVCTCNQSVSIPSVWPSVGDGTTSGYVTINQPDHQKRIADALERIATALEAMAPAPKYHCSACGKETEFYVSGPYGSKHEDEIICADCFDRAFGA